MAQFIKILTMPDNIPIVGMLLMTFFFFGLAMKEARKHDKLIAQGREDLIADEMAK